MTTEIAPGDVVRVSGGNKPGRPGVVARVFSADDVQKVLVPWGTGTLRADKKHVAVQPRTAAGVTLGIEKPTYFYSGNVTICRVELAERTGIRCPPELLFQLQGLVGL